MKLKFLCGLILFFYLIGNNIALGQKIPIGVAAWKDTVTGKISRGFGPGGEPALNYQKSDSSWDTIVDDWVQVGNRQIWRSVRGNHRVFIDSTGAAIYAKGNHYLGIKTTHLIKFNKADSTWVTLKSLDPDSISILGNTVTFHNIFPGIDKCLINNPKIFRQYMERFIFHQEARDSLAGWTPWANRLLGVATRLSVDSLNLSWKDATGIFDITTTGRMATGWIKAVDSDTMVFTLAKTYLHSGDSTLESIPIHKRLVLLGGTPYLVEMFNPVATVALPDGDLWHNVHFGVESEEGSGTTIEDIQFGGVATMGATGGTLDSIVAFTHIVISDHKTKLAIYKWTGAGGSGDDLIDSVPEWTATAHASPSWKQKAVQNNASLTANQEYLLVPWSEATADFHQQFFSNNEAYTGSHAPRTYTGYTWSDPLDHTAGEAGTWKISIYAVYTEEAAEEGNPRQNRIRRMGARR